VKVKEQVILVLVCSLYCIHVLGDAECCCKLPLMYAETVKYIDNLSHQFEWLFSGLFRCYFTCFRSCVCTCVLYMHVQIFRYLCCGHSNQDIQILVLWTLQAIWS